MHDPLIHFLMESQHRIYLRFGATQRYSETHVEYDKMQKDRNYNSILSMESPTFLSISLLLVLLSFLNSA